MQLWLVCWALRHLRWHWHFRRLLLQGVHPAGKRREAFCQLMLLFVSLLSRHMMSALHVVHAGRLGPDVGSCHMPHPITDSIHCTVADVWPVLLCGLLRWSLACWHHGSAAIQCSTSLTGAKHVQKSLSPPPSMGLFSHGQTSALTSLVPVVFSGACTVCISSGGACVWPDAGSVYCRETAVQKSSTWALQRQTFSTSAKNM